MTHQQEKTHAPHAYEPHSTNNLLLLFFLICKHVKIKLTTWLMLHVRNLLIKHYFFLIYNKLRFGFRKII